ncbi:MAG: hypothetical protein E7329_05055 [Clostridiales bacterium]|nr:hypothetical protein [Clostridiales bacterium]
MQVVHTVLCILGAMIGAGFASGREIMQFFSQYGSFSWVLVFLTVLIMTGLMYRVMQKESILLLLPKGKWAWAGKGFMLLLLLCVAGGMEAAAGELFALTLPMEYARGIGILVTAAVCAALCQRSMGILSGFGLLLLPFLLLALALCLRLPDFPATKETFTANEIMMAVVRGIGYAGMNVMLATGVLCDAGGKCGKRGTCRSALWAGGALFSFILLYNTALMPYRRFLKDQALPLVILLKGYGKAGFYLSAAILYLAVITTLIAVLRGAMMLLKEKFPRYGGIFAWLLSLAMALVGFEGIVSVAYPALGIICFLLLIWPQKNAKENACLLR